MDVFQEKLTDLRVSTKAFSDLGTNWIGCQGSKPMYGGYPCSAWTLWHTLTVSQLTGAKDDDPREVLRAMVKFYLHYIKCLKYWFDSSPKLNIYLAVSKEDQIPLMDENEAVHES